MLTHSSIDGTVLTLIHKVCPYMASAVLTHTEMHVKGLTTNIWKDVNTIIYCCVCVNIHLCVNTFMSYGPLLNP